MPRTYGLPNFNLACKVFFGAWDCDFTHLSFTAPLIAGATAVNGELYSWAHQTAQFGYLNTSGFGNLAIQCWGLELRVPKTTAPALTNTHIVASRTTAIVYCGPDADGMHRFYAVTGEFYRHKGFPNEHKAWHLINYFAQAADPYP